MFRPSENFLSTLCIACSLVVPLVTTTVLPFKSVGPEIVDAFGTISLVPATNISGENATCLARSALAVGDPNSRPILFPTTPVMPASEVAFTFLLLQSGSYHSPPLSSTLHSLSSRLSPHHRM